MHRFAQAGVCLLGLLLLTWVGRAAAAPPGPEQEAALFAAGNAALDGGALPEAAAKFEALLKDFPRSKHAPEACHKLACAYLLQGRGEDAKNTFVRLARDHFNSAWGQLSVVAYLGHKQVGDLADEWREKARRPGAAEDAAAAARLYQAYAARFLTGPQPAPGAKARPEVLFKLADCLRRLGRDSESRAGLTQVRDTDKAGNWGKLAALYLADGAAFKAGLKDFPALNAIGNEGWSAFLEVSERHLPELKGDERACCLCCRACCLAGLSRAAEAADLRRAVIKEFPGSAHAADCAFWLAEEHFHAGRRDEAKAAFLALAEKYPTSPRAVAARRWAGWADESDAAWKEAEGALAALIRRAARPGTGLAFTFRSAPAGGPGLRARLAVQDGHHALLDVSCGDSALLLVNGPEGTWYRGPGQAAVLRLRQPMETPVPRVAVTVDPAAQSFSLGGNLVPEGQAPGAPLLSLPPELAGVLVARLRTTAHLHREVRKGDDGKARVAFQLESARPGCPEPSALTVTLAADGQLHEVELVYPAADGKPARRALTDIVLGEKLPEDLFHFAAPPGTAVKDGEALNLFEIMAALMKFAQALSAGLPAPPG
jgi:TolA-binding protein